MPFMHFTTFKLYLTDKKEKKNKYLYTSPDRIYMMGSFHNMVRLRIKKPCFFSSTPCPTPATIPYLCSLVKLLLFGSLCSPGTRSSLLLILLFPLSNSLGCWSCPWFLLPKVEASGLGLSLSVPPLPGWFQQNSGF